MNQLWGRAARLGLCLLIAACGLAETPPTPGAPTGATPTAPATPTQPTAPPTPLTTPSPSPTAILPSPPSPTPPASGGVVVHRSLTYAHASIEECGERVRVCMQFVDVYAPAGAGPWPVAVMFHGRPRRPRDMEPLARAVAEKGAVVFNADYRGLRPVVQRGWPVAVEDIACAMRYARANAQLYGGDPSTLVMVGHSFAGNQGPLVALGGDEFDGGCLYSADEVSALPTGFVGIAGNYIVEPDGLWNTFYGGTPEQNPDAWLLGDFRTHLGGNPELRVRIIHELRDPIIPPRQPRRFFEALDEAGYDVELLMLQGNQHFALLDPDGNGARVVPYILELLGIEE